ncbi:tetratricopeptide repeat protein [bacterium]|nr:MAG: tetratricopeptide repeat protein [bacterium]
MTAIQAKNSIGSELINKSGSKQAEGTKLSFSTIKFDNFVKNADILKRTYRQSTIRTLKQKNNPSSLVQLADIHMGDMNYRSAVDLYKKALFLNNNSLEILKKLISANSNLASRAPTLALKSRYHDQVEKYFKALIKVSQQYNGYVYDYLNYVFVNFEESVHTADDVELIMSDWCLRFTDNADIQNIYGLWRIKMNIFDNITLSQFVKAIGIDPSHVHALNNIAIYYLNTTQNQIADEYFLKAISADPDYPFAYENRASLYIKLGDQSKALSILKSAYEENVKLSEEWLGNLSKLLIDASNDDASNNFALAEEILLKLSTKDEQNPRIINNLGVIKQRQNYLDEAIGLYDQAFRLLELLPNKEYLNDTTPVILKNYASTSYDAGHYDKSQSISQQLVNDFPRFAYGHVLLARNKMSRQIYDSARRHLSIALELDPKNLEAAINMSYLLDAIDFDFTATIDLLQPLIALESSTSYLMATVINNYTYALIKSNKSIEAKKYLDLIPNNSFGSATKALYYLYDDKLDLALKYYDQQDRLLEVDGDSFNANMSKAFRGLELTNFWIKKQDYIKAQASLDEVVNLKVHKTVHNRLLDARSLLRSYINQS